MDQLTSSFADERAEPRRVNLQLDSQPMKLSGWAATNDQDGAGSELILSLMVGATLLGTVRRNEPRPVAKDAQGNETPAVGFNVPDYGLRAFGAITGLQDIGLSVDAGEDCPARFLFDTGSQQTAPWGPLGTRHRNSLGFRLADVWLESSRDLTLRFETGAKVAKSLDAYQCAGSGLVNVAADRTIAGIASLVTITLINPLAPVLLIFKGEDGSIDAIDFLPFPSLVRGGLHAAERMIVACGADDVADTAVLSAELVGALLQRLDEPSQSLASIRIDSSVRTGLEPIFDDDLLRWITEGLGINVRIGERSAEVELPAFISETLERYSVQEAAEGHTLHLPADCIPTIGALVRALPVDAAPQVVSGAMGIVDWNRHGRIWSVWQPPFVSRLEDFQFAQAGQFAPALAIHKEGVAADEARDVAISWPLALALRDQPVRIAPNSPFEVASDYQGPLLRKVGPARPSAVEVLVLYNGDSGDPLPLLESLTRQDGIEIGNVVLCWPETDDRAEVAACLKDLFDERHSIVSVPATAGRLEQIVAARGSLGDTILLIADATTVLTDARTVSTLTQMLEVPDVASVGCLLRAANQKMKALSAGYSLAQIDLRGTPGVSFGPIDPAIWRGPSTYPVVANPLALVVTRSRLLGEITAAGSTFVRPESDDLLFGIQLIERGGINLCTTIVSAYSSWAMERSEQATLSIPYSLSAQELARIAQSATTVQRVA